MTRRDFHVTHHGTICLLHTHTPRAERWIVSHVSDDAQYFGGALVVEPRYVLPIVDGLIEAGFTRGAA